MTVLLKLEIYSHNFAVSDISPSIRYNVEGFARRFIQYGFIKEAGRWIRQAIRIFASGTKDKRIMRFHINNLSAFMKHMENNGIDVDQMEIVEYPMYVPDKVDLPVNEVWSDRPHQTPAIAYIVEKNGNRSKLVCIQTGRGKSYISLRAASMMGFRLLIIVRPMYLDKWQEDIAKTYDIDFQDMVVIRGATSLIALIDQAVNDELDAKVILVSNKTLQPYIKLYEQFQNSIGELGYGCLPQDLCKTLKVGTVIFDEIHQDFHLNYKIFTYLHVDTSISLSATLVSDDDFITNMYEVMFPSHTRYQSDPYVKYVKATALIYKIMNPNKIRCKDYSRKTYSHNMFEQSISKNAVLEKNYFELILKTIQAYYSNDKYKPGDRCLVYCASIEFCTRVLNFLKSRITNKDIRRYVELDPYENLMTADISVTTLLSAGTAVDVPGLTTVILTTSVNSTQSNVQGFGRLREIPNRELNFIYFVCQDIPKQVEYHERKKEILKDRALFFKTEYYPKTL